MALSPFAGDLGNAIWTLVIFVIVVVVLGKFAWGPVLGLLQQREEFIHRSLSDAKRDRDEAEAQAEGLRREAAERAGGSGDDRRGGASRRRAAARGTPPTRQGRGRHAGRERRAADPARDRRARCSRSVSEAVDLSVAIASKLLQRNISKEDNEKLIDEALRQIDTTRSH